MESHPLDDALTVLAATAPEYGALGLSNHGPMGAEVLGHLGHHEAIEGWVMAYAARLDVAPPPAEKPLSEADWPSALGVPDTFPAWLALFETELADRPMAAVVGEWVPRLVPGTIGAAAHGLIRTAHGLRSFGEAATLPRRVEVATGLAYWASQYQELPGPPLLIGHQDVPQALADLPYLPEEAGQEPLIGDAVRHMADIADEFEQAVSSLGPGGDALALLDALAIGGARAYLRNAEDGNAIGLLHAVTAPMALELVLPWIAAEDHDAALAYAWQAVASLHVAYDIDRQRAGTDDGDLPAEDVLIAQALQSGDAHALKLTEAALRCHARNNDPALLFAAADATGRLRD